jgi:hypothetical protein
VSIQFNRFGDLRNINTKSITSLFDIGGRKVYEGNGLIPSKVKSHVVVIEVLKEKK